MRRISLTLVLMIAGACATGPSQPSSKINKTASRSKRPTSKPRLVLMITVDQLSARLLQRFRHHFSGGFASLLANGIHYRNTHYAHANTETATGHATLFTGAHPAHHGIVANDWVDRTTGKIIYNVSDPSVKLLGEAGQGRSPRHLLASTIGDELVLHDRRSRVFTVSLKDRAAILPAGRHGKAFWYSKKTGTFVSSSYYYRQYPAWVKAWRQSRRADMYAGKTWSLAQPAKGYLNPDTRVGERGVAALGLTFPHQLPHDKSVYSAIRYTPFADELTLAFAKQLLHQERLGRGAATDLLSISFSANDYIGHAYGPGSREIEDHLIRLDLLLRDLLRFVDKTVGLNQTLVVLTADHGGVEGPEYLTSLGQKAGRHMPNGLISQVNRRLQKKFGIAKLARTLISPHLFLDRAKIKAAGLDEAAVEREAAATLQAQPGIAVALAYADLRQIGSLADNEMLARVHNSFHPARSGSVYVVQEQFWFLYDDDYARTQTATHGSPWNYDTHVPLIIRIEGVSAAKVDRLVGPHQIAGSIAAFLGIRRPSAASRKLLHEILR